MLKKISLIHVYWRKASTQCYDEGRNVNVKPKIGVGDGKTKVVFIILGRP